MLLLWSGDFRDRQPSCHHPLSHPGMGSMFSTLATSSSLSSVIFSFLFVCVCVFFKYLLQIDLNIFLNHMLLFLGSSQISGGRVIGSGDGTRKGL